MFKAQPQTRSLYNVRGSANLHTVCTSSEFTQPLSILVVDNQRWSLFSMPGEPWAPAASCCAKARVLSAAVSGPGHLLHATFNPQSRALTSSDQRRVVTIHRSRQCYRNASSYVKTSESVFLVLCVFFPAALEVIAMFLCKPEGRRRDTITNTYGGRVNSGGGPSHDRSPGGYILDTISTGSSIFNEFPMPGKSTFNFNLY